MRILVLLAMLGGCLLINTDNGFAQVGPRQTPGGGGGQVVSRVTPEQVAAALTQAGMRSQVVTQNNQIRQDDDWGIQISHRGLLRLQQSGLRQPRVRRIFQRGCGLHG